MNNIYLKQFMNQVPVLQQELLIVNIQNMSFTRGYLFNDQYNGIQIIQHALNGMDVVTDFDNTYFWIYYTDVKLLSQFCISMSGNGNYI